MNRADHNSTMYDLLRIQTEQQIELSAAGVAPPLGLAGVELDRWSNSLVFQGVGELVELAQAIGYKEHRAVEHSPSRERDAQLEWVDAFKYLLAIAAVRGWDASEIIDAFNTKTTIVQSYAAERKFVDEDGLWVAFDIDDVLADYTRGMYGYCISSMTEMKINHRPCFDSLKNTSSIGEQLGLSRVQWEKVKSEARAEGLYSVFGVIEDGIDAVREAKRLGYNILMITNRQVAEYPRLYSDTVTWLLGNKIPYDALMFGSSKLHKLVQDRPGLLERIVVAFDDHPSNIREYESANIPCVLVSARENNYNGTLHTSAMEEYVADELGPADEYRDN